MFIKKLTRFSFAFLTGYTFFVMPAGKAFAVSNKLNLDTSIDPQTVPMPSALDLFLRLAVSLIIIAGLAYLVMKVLKKNMKILSKGESIYVLDQYAFSMNKGVYITSIAGKVYVLGVTDNSINLITEITDHNVIKELEEKAKERENEPIIPPSLLERILPGKFNYSMNNGNNFSEHIQKQIRKLQTVVENRGKNSREDDTNE